MTFKDWMKKEKLTMRVVAERLGCTPNAVCNLKNRKTTPSLEMALIVVRETKGEVELHEMLGSRKYTEGDDPIATAKSWILKKPKESDNDMSDIL